MRLKNEAPVTQLEIEVENILVENGYNRNDIQFRDNDRGGSHLRIGYWRQLSDKVIDQLGNRISDRVDIYDDDCGWLSYYELNQ